MTMTSVGTAVLRWLNRPARPTAVVVLAAASVLAVLTAIALFDLFTAPLPPMRYGPFGGPRALTGAVMLMSLFIYLGVRATRGLSPKALVWTVLLLIAAGPVGWALAALDSLGPDVLSSAGSASAFVAMFLLDVAPLLTNVGVIAATAELIRNALDVPRIKT